MDKLRLVTLAVLLVAAVVVACSEIESPTDIVAAASITQGEACADWSCDPEVCGHPTEPPYHACCIKSVYEEPCSYQDPCEEAPEPACDEGQATGEMPEVCEPGLCQEITCDYPFAPCTGPCGGAACGQSGCTCCFFDDSQYCPTYCQAWRPSCISVWLSCQSKSPPWCDAAN